MNVPLPQLPLTRRQMLRGAASGFGYLAFAALAAQAAEADRKGQVSAIATPPPGMPEHFTSPLAPKQPHFKARAKRVIFLFMQGAPSHVDTFDYKPELNANDGKAWTRGHLLASPWKFKNYGHSGIPISDLFPNVAKHADNLCVINSMHTDNPAHPQATVQLHTGSAQFVRPSMGAWVLYGLGTVNQNLPGFITINPPGAVGGAENYGSGFLPASYEGTRVGGAELIPNIASKLATPAQRRQLDLIQSMNKEMLARSGDNAQIEGVIESYELGFRMQSTVPQVMDLSKESKQTLEMYGIEGDGARGASGTSTFGRQCLMARRLAESGVRFIEVAHTGWDQHTNLQAKHTQNAEAVDKPVAALLADLKQRHMLDDTLVIFGGEFGRTPYAQNTDGRDHNNKGYSMWLAGGGVKGGLRYGATDEVGYKAEVNPVHVHDLHATVLALLGLDHEKLTYRYAGRDFRLTDVHGNVVKEIMV
jgi:hypothetical protein